MSNDVFDPSEYDPRFPGGNYTNWLLNVLAPEDIVALNMEQQIRYFRMLRTQTDAGVKPKKHIEPKLDLVALGLKRPFKPLTMRKIGT